MYGMIHKAWEFNLPVKGTSYRMRDIADTINTCSWTNFTYGVDMGKPVAQEYYDGLIQHLANMGVDFIKYEERTFMTMRALYASPVFIDGSTLGTIGGHIWTQYLIYS